MYFIRGYYFVIVVVGVSEIRAWHSTACTFVIANCHIVSTPLRHVRPHLRFYTIILMCCSSKVVGALVI